MLFRSEALLWFYRCGAEAEEGQACGGGGGPVKKAYCFEQDADLIFAAFWGQYNLDLSLESGLHWWKFRALFMGLPAECELKKIMGY